MADSGSVASSDLYGTGVRLGFYLQGWSFLLNCFFADITEIPGQLLPTAMVSFSFLCSIVILIVKNAISQDEIFIIINLIEIPMLSTLLVMNIAESRSGGMAIFFTLVDVIFAEGLFVYTESRGGKKDRAYLIIGCILLPSTFAVSYKPVVCWYRMAVRFWKGEEDPEMPSTKLWDIYKLKLQNLRLNRNIPITYVVVLIVCQIVVVERSIIKRGLQPNNQIQQPAQLIPLVIGVISGFDTILRVLRTIMRWWRNNGNPDESAPRDILEPKTSLPTDIGALEKDMPESWRSRNEDFATSV
jgi:hypothetical protein